MRKEEVKNMIMDFVIKNGRPELAASASIADQLQRAGESQPVGSTAAIGVNLGRVRYLQPSCKYSFNFLFLDFSLVVVVVVVVVAHSNIHIYRIVRIIR